MASPAQIEANQRKAQHSTGPRTAEGKAHSAASSTRHGFCSQSVLLLGDDPAEYQALLDELSDHYPCVDLTEDRLVREMANAEWRLRRIRQHQETLLTDACHEIAAADPSLDPDRVQVCAYDHLLWKSNTLAVLMRCETKFERQYDRAYRGWVSYQQGKRRNEVRMVSQPASRQDLASPLPPELLQRFRELAATNSILPNEPNPAARSLATPPAPAAPGPNTSAAAAAPQRPHDHSLYG